MVSGLLRRIHQPTSSPGRQFQGRVVVRCGSMGMRKGAELGADLPAPQQVSDRLVRMTHTPLFALMSVASIVTLAVSLCISVMGGSSEKMSLRRLSAEGAPR